MSCLAWGCQDKILHTVRISLGAVSLQLYSFLLLIVAFLLAKLLCPVDALTAAFPEPKHAQGYDDS